MRSMSWKRTRLPNDMWQFRSFISQAQMKSYFSCERIFDDNKQRLANCTAHPSKLSSLRQYTALLVSLKVGDEITDYLVDYTVPRG
jgi:hypothetical protein